MAVDVPTVTGSNLSHASTVVQKLIHILLIRGFMCQGSTLLLLLLLLLLLEPGARLVCSMHCKGGSDPCHHDHYMQVICCCVGYSVATSLHRLRPCASHLHN
jgi:hypothetical protein